MREISVSGNEAGQRLDKLLRKYLREAGSGFLYRMLRKKNIVLNDRKADGRELLREGDSVKLYFSEETLTKLTGEAAPETYFSGAGFLRLEEELRQRILYEDEGLLLLNKPAGWVSQSDGSGAPSVNELCLDYLLKEGKLSRAQLATFKPGIANRLDRNTSGLILFGKTLPVLQELAAGLRERSLQKYYLAVVSGIVEEGSLLHGYLRKDAAGNQVEIRTDCFPGAAEIHTEYTPLRQCRAKDAAAQYSVLRVHLISGKTHQIRAHLASVGHPILGDGKYGQPRRNEYWRRRAGIHSQLLHAYELCFPVLPESAALAACSARRFFAEPPEVFRTFLP